MAFDLAWRTGWSWFSRGFFFLGFLFFCPHSPGADISGKLAAITTSNAAEFGWTLGSGELAFSGYNVRIMGTALSSPASASGTFSFASSPTGSVKLVLEEPSGYDVFTHDSRRLPVTVTGSSVTGADFALDWHWREVSGYHTNWGLDGYDSWIPLFVSEQIVFVAHRVTGVTPERFELYRTLNHGVDWTCILTHSQDVIPRVRIGPFFFGDASHGVVLAEGDGVAGGIGFYQTGDGGANWNYVSLGMPPNCYDIVIERFTKISSSHWIAGGHIGGGVQGYSGDTYTAIWETLDSGETWSLAWNSDLGSDPGTFSALNASANGRAIGFCTPYSSGGGPILLRDAVGNWTRVQSNIVVNSGYGPADVPMVGDAAFIAGSVNGTSGVYRSDNAGASWTRIAGHGLQYMAFATTNKGFFTAGGPAYASYDGAVTIFKQAGGGGWCCHGNEMWAFDTTQAGWWEGGASDPNARSQLFTYNEPEQAGFEIYAEELTTDRPGVWPGERGVPLARLRARNWGTMAVELSNITWLAQGTVNEASAVQGLALIEDSNKDGLINDGDVRLSLGTFSSDNGTLTLGIHQRLEPWDDRYYFLMLDVASSAPVGATFSFSFGAADVLARRTDTSAALQPDFPPGVRVQSAVAQVQNKLFSEDFDSGTNAWSWDSSYTNGTWGVSRTAYVSSNYSAALFSHWAYAEYRSLTLLDGISVGPGHGATLSFHHDYRLDYNQGYTMSAYIHASVNSGSWQQVKYYPYGASDGLLVDTLPLHSYIPATGGSVRIRFQIYQGQGWGGPSWWRLDNILLAEQDRLTLASCALYAATNLYYPSGTILTQTVASVTAVGTTQWICRGWTATASAPASGSTNFMVFALTNATTIQWLFDTNYYFSRQITGSGTVSVPDGWYLARTNLNISAQPQAGWRFSHFLLNGTYIYCTNLALTLSAPQTLEAVFVTEATPDTSVGAALNAATPDFSWSTGGNLPWFYQTNVSQDGEASLQSGPIGNSQTSWFETTIRGPGSLTWWWRCSSQTNADYLYLYRNSSTMKSFSGETGWMQATQALVSGVNTVRWSYVKNSSSTGGMDAAWVSQVHYTPTRTIGRSPTSISRTGSDGENPTSDTLKIYNSGAGLLSYQVLDNASWLDLTSPTGLVAVGQTGDVSVVYQTAALPAGTYSAMIAIFGDANNSPVYIPVTLRMYGQPLLSRTPSSYSISALPGSDVGARTVQVWNSQGHLLKYQASSDAGWLSVDPVEGTSAGETDELTLQVSSAALPVGSYTGRVSITANATNAPLETWVYLTVNTPRLSLNTNLIQQAIAQGNNATAAAYRISNSGLGTLYYTNESQAGWLSIVPATGQRASGGSWQTVTGSYQTALLDVGVYTGLVAVSANDPISSPQYVTHLLTIYPFSALGEALNATQLVWSTGGSASWYGQPSITHDGVSAAQSGLITHNQSTWFESVITGPATLSWWWKVSSEASYDYLRFYVNGSVKESISGALDWQHKQYVLATGIYTCRWTYSKDGSASVGSDAGWVDEVVVSYPSGPVLALSSNRLAPQVITLGGDGTSQVFTVWNIGLSNLEYTISDNAGWLTTDPVSGASTGEVDTITASYDTDLLAAGIYTGVISVAGNAENAPCFVTSIVTVAGASVQLGSTSLTASVFQGQSAASQGFYIYNKGLAPLFYTNASSAPWLNVTPTSGMTAANGSPYMTVQFVDTASLAAGVYNGSITVSGTATNGPAILPVQLSVLSVLPLGEALNATQLVWSTGGTTNWFGQANETHDGVSAAQCGNLTMSETSWLEAPVTGTGYLSWWWKTSSQSGSDVLAFYLDGVSLHALSGTNAWTQYAQWIGEGTHTCRWVYAKNSFGTAAAWVDEVTFWPVQEPLLYLSSQEVFTYMERGDPACEWSFEVANAGLSNLNYTITTNVSWLSTDVSSGSSTGESDTIGVSIDAGSLPMGLYTGVITVAANATNSPGLVTVCVWVDDARLALTTNALRLQSLQGYAPPTALYGIYNAGCGQLHYTNTPQVAWLSVQITNGVAYDDASVQWMPVSVDPTGLAAGTHTGRIVVASNGAESPQEVEVIFHVGSVISLDSALNYTSSLAWATGGSSNWIGQTAFAVDGGAGLGFHLLDSQSNWVQTTFSGAGALVWWWSSSTEPHADQMTLYVDGVAQEGALSGETPWRQRMLVIEGSGSHTARWVYAKDASQSLGLDSVWLDRISFNPMALDSDFDQMSDWQEIMANTNPNDAGDYLQVRGPGPSATGGKVLIQWNSASNRTYRLWRTQNLLEGFPTIKGSGLPATPPMNTYTDTTATSSGAYLYRIEVE